MKEENYIDTNKSNETLSFLMSGLVALAENNWMYPYPSTLIRARGLLFGAYIEQGNWKFQSISEFLRLIQTPLKDWWPFPELPDGIDPDIPMIDSQLQISSQVEELLLDLDDLSGNQKFNASELKLVLDNRKIRDAVLKVQKHPELEDAYVTLRRFLIENPWINISDGIHIPNETIQLMGKVSDFYEKPSPNMLHEGKYWLCPRCNGILIWADEKPRCATKGLCEQIVDLAQAKAITNEISTLKMTFRKRVQLPGLPELELHRELAKIPGVSVALWPEADRYDLLVEKNGNMRWAIDVKDYASEFTLSNLLRQSRPPYKKDVKFYYVIPDYRERMTSGYLQKLKKLAPQAKIQLMSTFLREVTKA